MNVDAERRGNGVKMSKEKRNEVIAFLKMRRREFKKKCNDGHLNDAILLGYGVERVLDVALSYNAEMPNDLRFVATVKRGRICELIAVVICPFYF